MFVTIQGGTVKERMERLEKEVADLRGKLGQLCDRVETLEGEAAKPRLQALIDEYKEWGGKDSFIPRGTSIILLPEMYGFSYPASSGYSEHSFRIHVLTPQKAKWAEEHECKTKGGKK